MDRFWQPAERASASLNSLKRTGSKPLTLHTSPKQWLEAGGSQYSPSLLSIGQRIRSAAGIALHMSGLSGRRNEASHGGVGEQVLEGEFGPGRAADLTGEVGDGT